jgi:hypothetical protein
VAPKSKKRTRGTAVIPYRTSRPLSLRLSPNDLHTETLPPLSPLGSPEVVDYSPYLKSTNKRCSDQEGENARSYRRGCWLGHSGTSSQPPFNISLNYEAFRGLRTDPFYCVPGSRDSRIGLALDFFFQVLARSNDIVCYLFNVTNFSTVIPEILQDEYLLDAALGVIQICFEQAHTPGSQPSLYVLRHKGNAIVKVREKLSRTTLTVDDITLFAMGFLALLETRIPNSIAHNLHKRNIATIISQRGGLKSFQDGTLLKAFLMQYDSLWALENGTTIFPGERRRHSPQYPYHPFSPELCITITKLPPGFHDLVIARRLSFDILPILYRATHLTSLNSFSRLELLSKTRRLTKIYNDFWEACPCLAVSISEDSWLMLEKLICLTLICYSYIAFTPRSSQTALQRSRFELTKKIASYSPKSPAEEQCLVWMWVVLIDSWRTGSRLHPDGFSLLFILQQRFPRLRYVANTIAMTSQFLWTSALETSVQIYWDDLVSTE